MAAVWAVRRLANANANSEEFRLFLSVCRTSANTSPAGFVGFTATLQPRLCALAMCFPTIRGRLISHTGPLNKSRGDWRRRDPRCLFHHYPFFIQRDPNKPLGRGNKTRRGCAQIRPSQLDSSAQYAAAHAAPKQTPMWARRHLCTGGGVARRDWGRR